MYHLCNLKSGAGLERAC